MHRIFKIGLAAAASALLVGAGAPALAADHGGHFGGGGHFAGGGRFGGGHFAGHGFGGGRGGYGRGWRGGGWGGGWYGGAFLGGLAAGALIAPYGYDYYEGYPYDPYSDCGMVWSPYARAYVPAC